MRLVESFMKNLNEEDKYHYIKAANDIDTYGDEFNSMANTDVIDILNELETYFTGYSDFINEVVADSDRNYREYQFSKSDANELAQAAQKIREAKDLFTGTWPE